MGKFLKTVYSHRPHNTVDSESLINHIRRQGFWNKYFANDAVLRDALYAITDVRGKETEEMQREIQGLSSASKLPLKFVQAIQALYELQTLMVPIVNFTKMEEHGLLNFPNGTFENEIPKAFKILKEKIPWRGPGCTGIIATDSTDGTVNHARNLDFTPVPFMTNLVYTVCFSLCFYTSFFFFFVNLVSFEQLITRSFRLPVQGIFKKGGKELFRSQMVAGCM